MVGLGLFSYGVFMTPVNHYEGASYNQNSKEQVVTLKLVNIQKARLGEHPLHGKGHEW